MRVESILPLAALLPALLCLPLYSEELVYEGTLSESGPNLSFEIPQFDDLGGSLELLAIHFEFLTTTSGGYQTDGSGTSVDILSDLQADYDYQGILLGETQALIDMTIANPVGVPILAALIYETDTATSTHTDTGFLANWSGQGVNTVDVLTSLVISEIPQGVIGFGAGGMLQYTVTYEFQDALLSVLFIRGDSNVDGSVNIADAVATLNALFVLGTPSLPCDKSADSNDDGSNDISDVVHTLNTLFVASGPLTADFIDCSIDPTPDFLTCDSYDSCP